MKELGIASLSGVISGMVGMPWQAVLAFTLVALVCATTVSIVKTVLPQDSADRVLWAEKILNHRALRASRRSASPRALPHSAPRPRAARQGDQQVEQSSPPPGTAR